MAVEFIHIEKYEMALKTGRSSCVVVARQCSSVTDPEIQLPPGATMMPKKKVSADGAVKAEPKRLSAKSDPAKVDMGKDKASDKNRANKREEGSEGQTG